MPIQKLRGYTLEDLAKMERKEPDWIIGEWLTRNNTGFIIGHPKITNKSWLLLSMLWDLSEGQRVWGTVHPKRPKFFLPPRPMRCIYFAQEDALDDIHGRVLANLQWRQKNPNLIIVPKNWALLLDTSTGKLMIHDFLHANKDIDLIVFDTFRRAMKGSEDDSEAVAAMYKYVDELGQKYHCATIFAHHMVKPPRDERISLDYDDPFTARGSGDIYGGGDAFITIKSMYVNEEDSKVQLFFKTKRAAQAPAMTVQITYPPTDVAQWKPGVQYGRCRFIRFADQKT